MSYTQCLINKLSDILIINTYMNNQTLYKLTPEAVEKLMTAFKADLFQLEVKKLKEETATDNGTFKMVISTDNVDRHGEIVNQDGWITDNYMKNAVVLWGHDSYAIPVGITDKLSIVIENGVKSLVAEGRFAGHEFAQVLRKLYDDGMLRASSVGFIPLEYNGNEITKAELLEWSFVSIPANPFALSARGFNVSELIEKGIIKDIEKKEGETVETPVKTPEEIAAEEAAAAEAEAGEAVEDIDTTTEGEETTLSITLANGEVKTFKCAPTFKAGRVLSKVNRGKVEAAVSALEEVLAADTQNEENAQEVQPEGVKTDKELQEAEAFLKLRGGLQGLATIMGEVLAEAKIDAKKIGVEVR